MPEGCEGRKRASGRMEEWRNEWRWKYTNRRKKFYRRETEARLRGQRVGQCVITLEGETEKKKWNRKQQKRIIKSREEQQGHPGISDEQ